MPGPAVPDALRDAVSRLWRIRPPGPDNIFYAPEFVRVREVCQREYPNAGSDIGLSFALGHACRALGLPCELAPGDSDLALPARAAAERLNAAFRWEISSRTHLCPLNLAGDLPDLDFGPNSIRQFTEEELDALVDPKWLRRIWTTWSFESSKFAEFKWLVVRETVPLNVEPGARAVPVLYSHLNEDLGAIEPHRGQFPAAVEAALFALLQLPWEDWTEMAEVDWRCFEIPWVYTLNDDIFVRPERPPSPESLEWQPVLDDGEGGEIEMERPLTRELNDSVARVPSLLDGAAWSDLERARQTPLFETPIAHFFVRAFLASGIDEFLAHVTTIEAALGLRSDYQQGRATHRVAGRVAGFLGGATFGETYKDLFNIRSNFLHGRPMSAISSDQRNLARSLARKTVNALTAAALAMPADQSREEYLQALSDVGLGTS